MLDQRAVRPLVVGGAVAAAYVIAAQLGFRVAFGAEQITTVWPPTGIAIAALLLYSPRFWPAIWIGAFSANAATSAPLWTAASIATGNTLEAYVAAVVLIRFTRFDVTLRRARDAVAFLLLAGMATPVIAATIGVVTLCAAGVQPWGAYWPLWFDWALGDATGALIVAPAILTSFRVAVHVERRQFLETAGLVILAVVITEAVFGSRLTPTTGAHPLEFIVFPLLITAAVRVRQPGTALVGLAASIVAIVRTVQGFGPFAAASVHQSLVLLQVFMGILASTGLVLAAAMTERRLAERRRSASHAVGQVLANAKDLETAAPTILRAMCAHLECQFAALWIVDRAVPELSCVTTMTHGVEASAFVKKTREIRLPHGVGLPGRVWAQGTPVWIDDVVIDANFPRAGAARDAGLHGAFGFPIWLGDELIGIVEFFYRKVASPDADLLATSATIGHQIGQFIGRTRVELAMRVSEQRTRTVLETALDAIISMDHQGLITEFNAAAERIFGHRRDEVIGRELAMLLMPVHLRDAHRKGVRSYLSTRTGGFIDRRIETTAVRADGREFPAEVSITAVPGDGPPQFTGFVRDVTERVEAEHERLQLLKRERDARLDAEAANRAKDQFLATLSHELRTPLNAIVGWARMLLDGAVSEENRTRALEIIERNAHVQVQLVADLLDVSRIIMGQLKLEMRPVDVGAVIGASLDAVRPAAEAKRIALRSTLPPSALVASGDVARLQQILWNLLSNAVKFTPEGGHVHVDLTDNGPHIGIHVRDSGPGIAPAFLPHVFERFRQADSSSTREHGGLGLGLAIVRHLVELHGGRVRVENADEGGAIFSVELPRGRDDILSGSAGHAVAEGWRQAARGAPSLAGCRVLVVDDDDDTRELFAAILLNAGAQVQPAGSVRDALAYLRTEWPDVLLADIAMPDQDGYVLIRQVRSPEIARGRHLPGAAITAYGRREDQQRTRAEGFDLYVSKPVEPSALVDVVASLWKPIARSPAAM